MTQPIFIGGTSSHVGKSWMSTAICAWLRRQGIRVAPFKAQNMSNNSYPCRSGGEIGRAQVAQAWACGLEPEPAMNPILLKPNSEGGSQVVLNGKVWRTLAAQDYYQHADLLRAVVLNAYQNLASRFEVIIIEGAGSVAELNLRRFDFVNLWLVTQLAAPWLLVGDIERGGIFASIIGTVDLLGSEHRSLLRAFAINKFRGDLALFGEGRKILEERTRCLCLGVFPYTAYIHLDDEDSLSVPESSTSSSRPKGQQCAIIHLPRISNTTDFRLLPGACWITRPIEQDFDFVFLPGTKNTIDDLKWLRAQKLDDWILAQYRRGATLIGICGGFQMLGQTIRDPFAMESSLVHIGGLRLLPVNTTMSQHKTTRVVKARTPRGHTYSAYEIHLGETVIDGEDGRPFAFLEDGKGEGILGDRIVGTYLHGAFENPEVLLEMGIAPDTSRISSAEALADWFGPFGKRFKELFL